MRPMGCGIQLRLSTQPASPTQRGGHSALGLRAVPSPLRPDRSVQSACGFTFLEMLIVLFLLSAVLALVVPRISLDEDLSSTGRKFIGALRTLQRMAAAAQKPVKLYVDIDRGTYWAMVVDGKEERRPIDAGWAAPFTLPETIRFTEVSVGQMKRTYGRTDLSFFPNGRIESATVYFSDTKNNFLGLTVDSLTGNIRTFDQRPDLTRPRPIPDRVRSLLQSAARG